MQSFIKNLLEGRVCLHPTDTIPGFTVNPKKAENLLKISTFKNRDPKKPFIFLAPDVPTALEYFAPMPESLKRLLKNLWPNSITVIYSKSEKAKTYTPEDTIAIRVPKLDPSYQWMIDAMKELGTILPSTSINQSGFPPCVSWKEATLAIGEDKDIYVPTLECPPIDSPSSKPSTLIRLTDDGSYTILREGSITESYIKSKF